MNVIALSRTVTKISIFALEFECLFVYIKVELDSIGG